jgi:hypothetical protein
VPREQRVDSIPGFTDPCTIPAGRVPVPGEHLTVPDTLPDPAAGAGRYYVAAVRHGAQVPGRPEYDRRRAAGEERQALAESGAKMVLGSGW